MGLDTVEIVLTTEEVFGISLPDEECATFNTVGALYRGVLGKLGLSYLPAIELEAATPDAVLDKPLIRVTWDRNASLSIKPPVKTKAWTTADVWLTLKAIIMDQLQVEPDEVREDAHWVRDLGCA